MINNSNTVEYLYKRYASILFIILSITTVLLAVDNYRDYHAYKIGDWLINYQAGFIRRGFFGELVYLIHSFINIDLGLILIILQISIYITIFYLIYKLLNLNNDYLSYSLIIISPFFLFFHVTDYQGGFRKEILYFLALSYLVYQSHKGRDKFKIIFYFILVLYPLLILTHEMLALFLPYLLIAYFLVDKFNYIKLFKISLITVPSIIAFIYSVTYVPNNVQINNMIEIISISYAVEPSGILWLEKDIFDAKDYTNKTIFEDYYIFYIFLLFLIYLSFIPIKNKVHLIFKQSINKLLLIIMLIGTVILSMVAIDWGRFIYIHIFSIVLITLIQSKDINREKNSTYIDFINRISSWQCTVIYFSYALLWYFPHVHPLKGVTRPFRLIEGAISPYLKIIFY